MGGEDWPDEEVDEADWLLEAALIVEIPTNAAPIITALAGVEPSDLIGLGAAGRILWVLNSDADPEGATLDEHVEAIAESLDEKLDSFVNAIAEHGGKLFIQANMTPGAETPVLSLSAECVALLDRLQAGIRIETLPA